MIVCLCRAVAAGAVRAARDGGARMVASIGLVTGAGTDCGCCRSAIARILGEATCEGPALQASCPGTARPGDRLGPSGPVEASWAHAGGA